MFNNNDPNQQNQQPMFGGSKQQTFVRSAEVFANILAAALTIIIAPYALEFIEPRITGLVMKSYGEGIGEFLMIVLGILIFAGTWAFLRMSLVTCISVGAVWFAGRALSRGSLGF